MSINKELMYLDEALDYLNDTVVTIPQLIEESNTIFNEFNISYITEGKILKGFKNFIEKVKEWFKKIARKIRELFDGLKINIKKIKMNNLLKNPISLLATYATVAGKETKLKQAIEYVKKNNIDTEIKLGSMISWIDDEEFLLDYDDLLKKTDDIFYKFRVTFVTLHNGYGNFDESLIREASDKLETLSNLIERVKKIDKLDPLNNTIKLYEVNINKFVEYYNSLIFTINSYIDCQPKINSNIEEVEKFIDEISKFERFDDADLNSDLMTMSKSIITLEKDFLVIITNILNDLSKYSQILNNNIAKYVKACLEEYKKANKNK